MNARASIKTDELLPEHASGAPDPGALKEAFSLFPSGVVIATALDADGSSHGFTASTFAPLSVAPPMVLVCLNKSAQCFDVFNRTERFAVSVLRPDHEAVAMRFATRGADKFADSPFEMSARGLPLLRDALASFECLAAHRYPGGDHVILTGLVETVVNRRAGSAMVYCARSFRGLEL